MINGHGDDAYKYKDIRIDFSSNISAHSSHEALMKHLAARPDLLDHYPEPEAWSLEQMIAERHDIEPACVIVTSGATEAIYLIAHAFRYRPVIPQPTFSEYADACEMAGVEEGGREVMWLCNPNNPTGEVYDQLYIDRMMAEYDLLVLDQSYEGYTDAPVMTPRRGCRTTCSIQIHSMTKMYGVPGLRLGYITAHEQLTEQLRRYLRPWSVSALAVEAGKYLLQHEELLCQPNLAEARRLRDALLQLPGISVAPTQTNFMLCGLAHSTAAALQQYLATQHCALLRDAARFRGPTPQPCRTSAQPPEANDALISAISHVL